MLVVVNFVLIFCYDVFIRIDEWFFGGAWRGRVICWVVWGGEKSFGA